MRYFVFMPERDTQLENVFRSLSNIAPELDKDVNILIWTDDESVYFRARNDGEQYLDGGVYNSFRVISSAVEDKVSSIKQVIVPETGSVVIVNPDHILGYGCVSSLYFVGRIYKYGFFALQTHNKCIDCPDLYDETSGIKSLLEGHDKIGDDIYMVDDTFDATYLVKMDNFKKYWLDDEHLGVYLRRLGYCNFVDKSFNIIKGK